MDYTVEERKNPADRRRKIARSPPAKEEENSLLRGGKNESKMYRTQRR